METYRIIYTIISIVIKTIALLSHAYAVCKSYASERTKKNLQLT